MTFDSEIDFFIATLRFGRELSENTCAAYARDLVRFGSWLEAHGRRSLSDVTRADIDGFLASELDSGMSSATRCRRTAAIRTFFGHLKERHVVASDPSELLDVPKRALVLPRVLSEQETFAMLDAIDGKDPRSLRDRAMLEVMYGCGLRVSEVCSMCLGDFMAEGELLRIVGKGSKERVVPVGPAAGRTLIAYVESGRISFARDLEERHVFLTRLGKPFTRQGVFKIIKERAASAGIAAERVSPHVLRHCFASHMLQHGADIRAIQEMLGHADIGTTQVYTHVDATRFGEIHRRHHPRARRDGS